jgi:alpha-galactosidase
MKHYLLLFSVLLPSVLLAQKPICIQTRHSDLIFSVGPDQRLYQDYFGKEISPATMAGLSSGIESYLTGGGRSLFEPALRLVHGDGNPSLELKVVDHTTLKEDEDRSTTRIVLKDPVYPVTVELCFTAYYREDVITSRMEIIHSEDKPVRLYNFASSMLHFNADSYWLTQFHGDFAREMKMQESRLTSGIKIIDSKLGTRADMYQSPMFFLSLNGPSSENTGDLIAGTLAWSGNFQLLFEMDNENRLNVAAGMNPYASDYLLAPGKRFTTPEFIFTWSAEGMGAASRNLHRWARNNQVLDGNGPRYSLLNNWEATQFDFNEKKLDSLFDQARTLGVDMFLLDDGWFANKYPRNSDHSGLGDWQENTAKLPDGIGHLVKSAGEKGLKFGIWIEPEMVNPKSELYEKHPDWVLKLPNRPEDYFRNQLVLDLVNPAVQEFVYKTVDDMLSRNPGIAYIKWDCNRPMTNTYSPYARDNQSSVYIDYVQGLYAVLARLRAKYPTIPMMLCAGGGGRTDYAALKYFTEFWPSDDTDPFERIFIQWGYSYFFPAKTIACHITSWGKESLKFKTDVAMMGRMGYDLDIARLSARDLAFSQQAVRNYKRLSGLIWQGDQYRLADPYSQERAVVEYADNSQSHAVIFAYTLHPRYGTMWTPVRLQGLDPGKVYRVRETNLYPGTVSGLPENGRAFTGEYLMSVGLQVSSQEALSSSVVDLTAEDRASGASGLTIPFGKDSRLVYDLSDGTYAIYFHHRLVADRVYALCKGSEKYDSRAYDTHTYSVAPFTNAFGSGQLYTITHDGYRPLKQLFYVFPGRNYVITEVQLQTGEGCNYMAPLVADHLSFGEKGDNRALFVPYDNDMWVRYNAARMDSADFTGSEVTVLYNDDDLRGMVIGSLEQDTWKTGIRVKGGSDTSLAALAVFNGWTDPVTTHDQIGHGMVRSGGGVCRGTKVLIGDFEDWRMGMETYARLDSLAAPKSIFDWKRPAPMGWNSWGVMQNHLSLAKAKAVVDFFADSCQGFRNGEHTLFIDLDAFWDNMTPGGLLTGDVSQLESFVASCRQHGLRPGIYWTPFADWGKTDRKIEGGSHTYPETWTRQQGQVMDVDGGRAMDPTHPGTRDRIVATLTRLKQLGFEMIKIDFLGHGALEADHFYDTTVTTGMQAFHQGMAFVDSVLGGQMLVYAAISPNIATARYVHMRRIGCDAFSAIDNTEYTLNSSGYGWWQSGIYDFMDADHVVFGDQPEGVNRARLVASLVTGTLITGDDYSAAGKWKNTAHLLLQNRAVLAAVGKGKSFRPVYANTGNRGVQVFVKDQGDGLYVAVINYRNDPLDLTIPLSRLGVRAKLAAQAQGTPSFTELFTGRAVASEGGRLTLKVAANDAAIYRL